VTCANNQETIVFCDGVNATVVGSAVAQSASFAVGDYKHSAAPAMQQGWILCNGGAYSRTTYSALFAAIGGYYGSGDGSTTFNVPNLIGRTLVHADQNQGVAPGINFAQYGGTAAVTLDISQIPYHDHGGGNHSHSAAQDPHVHGISSVPSGAVGSAFQAGSGWVFQNINTDNRQPNVYVYASGATIGAQGSSGGHTNLQPCTGCYVFIYAGV
jgi:microcystin-dependent protein